MASKGARRRSPPSRWLLVSALVLAFAIALLGDGYAHHTVGGSSTRSPGASAPQQPGALLSFHDGRATALTVPPRTVLLTFDDGPDPHNTPRLLDLLRRKHVKATFFVVGSEVLSHPSLVRRELAEGHDIGSHTFTHADLGTLPVWRQRLELSLTQSALASAAHTHTALMRLPYSSTPGTVSMSELGAARRAGKLGYLVAFADRDAEDWRRPGVDRIVARALPSADAGAVVMLHDGGGNRDQTLAATSRLIDVLRARGFRFATVSDLGVRTRASASSGARWQGRALAIGLAIAALAVDALAWLLVPIAVLAVVRAIVVALFARRHSRRVPVPATEGPLPPVSIVVPAYNEEVGIAATVRSLASSDYPEFEIIVIDDGSTDATSERVRELAIPNVVLIRQPNAGKAPALNHGIATARHDVIVSVDADTQFEPDSLRMLVSPLADARVGAVSGNTKVGNRRGLLGRWQHIEYVLGFNLDRRMFDVLGCIPTVPGAIGAFRRQALDEVGGVSDDTLAEDTDLTMAIIRAGWQVVYEERARAWTEAPARLRELWRQRYRWCYGTLQATWKHRAAFRERSRLGRVGLPYLLLFQVALPLLAPVIDVLTIFGLLFLDPWVMVASWLAFNFLQLGLAAYAFHLDGEPLGTLWALPLQQFVYRQLMYAVVAQSVLAALGGTRLGWHKLERSGTVALPADPT